MLDPLSTWTSTIQALPPSPIPVTGATNFAAAIGQLMNKVQAGPTGLPTIFTLNQPVFVSQLLNLQPPNIVWIANLAMAWEQAVLASTITPGTVNDSSTWTDSNVDTETVPAAATTIITIPVAFAQLSSDLAPINAYFLTAPLNFGTSLAMNPMQLAKAFRDATLQFQFNCIGLQEDVVPVPVPVVFPAL